MRLKKAQLLLILGVIVVVCTSLASVFAYAADDVQTIYDENKTVVSVIDSGNYFDSLYQKAQEDNGYLPAMQGVVEVAKAFDEFSKAYDEADYTTDNYTFIQNIVNQTKQYVTLEAEVAKNYDKQKYLDRIAYEKSTADAVEPLPQAFARHLAEAKAAVTKKYTDLTSVNTTKPTGKPWTVVGFYDNDGMQELEDYKNDFDSEADTISADYAAGEKTYGKAVDSLNTAKTDYVNLMEGVRKNVVERAADALADY